MCFSQDFIWKPGGFFLSQYQIKISNFMLEKTILNLIFQKPIFNIFATNMKVGEREGMNNIFSLDLQLKKNRLNLNFNTLTNG